MNMGVLGTGVVGRTLAVKLAELGHAVVLGTRDVRATLAQTAPDRMGNPPLKGWLDQHAAIRLGSFAEAAEHGEMLLNATNGMGSLAALEAAGAANLRGKVLVDISNPLDFSQGMPPSLFVSNANSLAEQIQRTFPGSRVVKTLNTVTAPLMVDPGQVNAGKHSIFLSGNDAAAKMQVRDLLRGFGWTEIIDLGDLSTARGRKCTCRSGCACGARWERGWLMCWW